MFDALLEALNGGSEDAWEAFAQARFSPSFLQKQSRAERAQLYRQIVDRFGAIAVEQVRRQGPDAPLQMMREGLEGRRRDPPLARCRLAAAHRRPAIGSGRRRRVPMRAARRGRRSIAR